MSSAIEIAARLGFAEMHPSNKKKCCAKSKPCVKVKKHVEILWKENQKNFLTFL